jgi:short-subunit dehydrogenase
MKNPNIILITGATSGIGAALAVEYAERGVKLLLIGRDMPRLAEVEQRCRAKGAAVKTAAIDVTDRDKLQHQILVWDDQEAIDLVIANAGISGGGLIENSDHQSRFEAVIDINVMGSVYTITPLISRMRSRKKGQIALLSSLAGFRGLPSAAAYSTSKVAMRALGQSLRPLLARDNIGVSVIHPGFVKTPLTDVNGFYMPFLMTPEKSATIIRDGLAANKATVAFPWPMYVMARLMALMPSALLALLPRKG